MTDINKGHSEQKPRSTSNTTRGRLFIVSGPSGSGKTTLCRAVLKKFPGMLYSVSFTTRKPRQGEENGVDYHFIKTKDFKDKIESGKWAEWAEVHGNYYGTSAQFIDKELESEREAQESRGNEPGWQVGPRREGGTRGRPWPRRRSHRAG